MLLLIGSCPCPWVPDSYFHNHFFFFFQADRFYCGCVDGYECRPAGYGSYWGKCVEESGSGMGAWYPSNRHVYDGTRNMKSLFTLGKLMQRTKTWIKQFCENRELIAIDILAFQSDMIYKRVAIFLLPLIYFELFVCLFVCFCFSFLFFALDKGGHFPSLTQSFSTRIHDFIWFQGFSRLGCISRASNVRRIAAIYYLLTLQQACNNIKV